MAFARPTLDALYQQSLAFFKARLPGADMALRRAALVVTARVFSGLLNGCYGYLDYLANVLLPDTQDPSYLPRWAAIYNIPQEGATPAAGNAILTGTAGTLLAGAVLQRSDGAQFATQADATLSSGTVTVAIEALTPGAPGNTEPGGLLTLTTAVSGFAPTATVDGAGLTGGTDQEAPASWSARLLSRIRQPPQGGDANDYVTWAKLVAGVTRAWVYPLNRGPGTVDVAFVMDGRANIIPLTADVAAVQASIDAQRPVTADSVVFAPVATHLAVTVHNLTPNSAATQSAVLAALQDLLMRVASPGCTIAFADIDAAIEGAAGVTYHFVSSPSVDVVFSAGQMPVIQASDLTFT